MFLRFSLLMLPLMACEQLPPLPATFQYDVQLKSPGNGSEAALVGWAAYANGKKLGLITTSRLGVHLVIEAPAGPTIESIFAGTELRSPCGTVIALAKPIRSQWLDDKGAPSDEKTTARKLYKYHLEQLAEKRPGIGPVMTIDLSAHLASMPKTQPTPHPVLVARGGITAPLTIGALRVDPSLSRFEVPADCGDELPVKVGDEEIGTWSATSAATFISLAPDACFLDRVVTYGADTLDGSGGGGTLRKGRGVFVLGQEPQHFLSKAPAQLGAARDTKTAYRTELDSTPCPP